MTTPAHKSETAERLDIGEHGHTGWVQWLKTEISVSVGLIGGIMLATGYLLTWARIDSDGLPSQTILTALPRTYFVTTGVESMLSPLVIAVVLATIWVPRAVWLTREKSAATLVLGWGVFGATLGMTAAIVARWVNQAVISPDFASPLTIGATIGSGALAACAGYLVRRWELRARVAARAAPRFWDTARPILAATLLLCFAVGCGTRILDVVATDSGLPFSQVVVAAPCAKITNGIPPASKNATSPDAAKIGDRCQIGGFYLGATDDWIFLAQPRNPCKRPQAGPPQLLMLSRSSVQALAARKRSHAPACGTG